MTRRPASILSLLCLGVLLAGADEREPLHGFSLEDLKVPRDLVVEAAARRDPVASVDAPGFGPGPVVEQKSTSPASRGRSDPLLLEHLSRARTHTA